jgi:hypothetical protein
VLVIPCSGTSTNLLLRLRPPPDLANEDNSQYSAEFVIDGHNVDICSNDLSFEYSSESGLLHVYIESVHLDTPTDATSSAIGQGFATADHQKGAVSTGSRAAGEGRGGKGSIGHKGSYNNSDSSSSSSSARSSARAGVVSKFASGVKSFFTFSRK